MKIHKSVTLEKVMEACENDDNEGFCIGCGHEHSEVEPDARGYKCENCDQNFVYGAQELLILLA